MVRSRCEESYSEDQKKIHFKMQRSENFHKKISVKDTCNDLVEDKKQILYFTWDFDNDFYEVVSNFHNYSQCYSISEV